jgi:uncharacterized protein YbjT (DUF2867 family)
MLITGSTGYVGSHLTDRLRSQGVLVRLAGRDAGRLLARSPGADVVTMDVLDLPSIVPAFEGIRVAYYLVHSMGQGGPGFQERDRRAALAFGEAAKRQGVERIVYLGGLGDPEDELSHHLASRQETGRMLAESGPQVVEFRAGIIIGSGGASYRMLADLVKRLPVMVTPKWVTTRSQPIAIDDVVSYLEAAASTRIDAHHQIVEIGGADIYSYRDLMRRFAQLQGRRPPVIVSVPVLTPRLSSLWCGLVTSVPASIARPLIDGLRNEVIVRDPAAHALFPEIEPIGFDEAVRRAQGKGEAEDAG